MCAAKAIGKHGIIDADKLENKPNSGPDVRYNTGPKGVRADYAKALKAEQNINLRERLRFERENQKNGRGTYGDSSDDHKQSSFANDDDDDDDDELSGFSSDDDLSDDEEARMLQLQAWQRRQKEFEDSLPTFGSFDRVTVDQMSTIINRVESYVWVIVHVYENDHEGCTRLNLAFEDLSIQYTYVRFIRVRATEALPNSVKSIPVLLMFRNKKKEHMAYEITGNNGPLKGQFTDMRLIRWLHDEFKVLDVPKLQMN